MGKTHVNRKHKDSLFRMIFGTKEELLSLYNAMNGSHYENPEELELTTIEDVIYMGVKNDASFILDEYLNLYEAQSTWNPNMPLRGLGYFSRLYQGYVDSHHLDIYSSVRLTIPTPNYVVFYNGSRDTEDVEKLRLSDSFAKKEDSEPALECVATLVNINLGRNQELMKNCRKLYEYARFIKEVRSQLAGGYKLEMAMDKAIEVCIREGVLEEFLRKHRAEVTDMFLTDYDEELHIRSEKALSYKEGRNEGEVMNLLKLIVKKLKKEKSPKMIAEELEEEPEKIQKICEFMENHDFGDDCDELYKQLHENGIM